MARLSIRLTKKEKEILIGEAKAEGLDLSKYVRKKLGLKNKNISR